MNTRRFILHLIIALLTFVIGVTAAVALGGFNPLERLSRSRFNRQLTIPPQPLSEFKQTYERQHSCPNMRPRTAELRYRNGHLIPPPTPIAPYSPNNDELETAPRISR